MHGVLRTGVCVALTVLVVARTFSGSEASEKVLSGTGFAINETGLLVTNHHAMAGCANVLVHQSGPPVVGLVVDSDPTADLALIKLTAKTPAFAVFRQSPALRAGDQAVAFGFPLSGVLASEGNLTVGYVSSLSAFAMTRRESKSRHPFSQEQRRTTVGHEWTSDRRDYIEARRHQSHESHRRCTPECQFRRSLPTLSRFLKRHRAGGGGGGGTITPGAQPS